MRNHSDIRKLLSAHCGDDLSVNDCTEVEEHLKSCSACRSELTDLQTTLKLLRTTREVEPPPWMTIRIMAHVREQQELKPGWLKRIFFPMHIKLPLEGLALLFVCFTGLYISQRVGTELQQTSALRQEDIPPDSAPAQVQKASEKKSVNTAPISVTKDKYSVSLPKVADQPHSLSTQQPAATGESTATPSFAPAPPAKEERSEPPSAKRSSNAIEPYKAAPKGESLEQTLGSAAPEMQKKAARSAAKRADGSESTGYDHAGGAGVISEQLTIRMVMIAQTQADKLITEALIRSEASIIDEPPSPITRIRARIPVGKLDELFKRLDKVGKIVERPQYKIRSGTIEMNIYW